MRCFSSYICYTDTTLYYNLSTALFEACSEEKYRVLGVGFELMIYYSRYLQTILRDRFYNLFIA